MTVWKLGRIRNSALSCAALGLATTSLAACGATTSEAVSGDSLTIPYLAAVAGPAAGAKEDIEVPPELIMQKVSGAEKSGKLPELKIVMHENNLDPTQAVRDFKNVMESDPVVILGAQSNTATAIAPLAARAKVPFVALGTSSVATAADNRPWVFTPWADAQEVQGQAVGQWLDKEPQVKKVVVIINEQEAASKVQGDAASKGAESADAEVVETVSIDTDTTDFAPVIARAKKADADGVIIATQPAQASALAEVIQEQNWDVSGYLIQNTLSEGFFTTVGDAADGFYAGSTFFAGSKEPTVAKYVADFKKLSGDIPPTYPQIYDGLELLVAALETVDLEGMTVTEAREAIRDALEAACTTAVTGQELCFNDDGYVEAAPILLTVGKGGSLTEVASQ